MEQKTAVIEYKCPCCDAGLEFDGEAQQLKCEYCGNSFEIEVVQAFNDKTSQQEEFAWEEPQAQAWTQEEEGKLHAFQCPSCGGEILSDENTAATFCPYCGNPTILPSRLGGGVKPDAVLPFRKSKEDAKTAFLQLCKGKPLLPKEFTQKQQIEKLTGLYVPFWLYDCRGDFSGRYQATRVRTWSDSNYNYTKTSHYLLIRQADGEFVGIPVDGSSKMEDIAMESIEPFDYSQLVDFDMAYLSGYLADKYDVPAEDVGRRIQQRVEATFDQQVRTSMLPYTTAIPTARQLHLKDSRARYALMPVWVLNTRYKDKMYSFVMNGQTGKMTGQLPVCPKRTAAWFAGICAGVTALAWLLQWLIL